MTWSERLDTMSKGADLLLKLELHAFAMIGIGAVMYGHGNHEQGSAVIGAGLLAFRGNRQ